jgi:hypothetical protein
MAKKKSEPVSVIQAMRAADGLGLPVTQKLERAGVRFHDGPSRHRKRGYWKGDVFLGTNGVDAWEALKTMTEDSDPSVKRENIRKILQDMAVGFAGSKFDRFLVWRVSELKWVCGIGSINIHQTGDLLDNVVQFIFDNFSEPEPTAGNAWVRLKPCSIAKESDSAVELYWETVPGAGQSMWVPRSIWKTENGLHYLRRWFLDQKRMNDLAV